MYILTGHLRAKLKLPLGNLIPNEERTRSRIESLVSRPLILVGDVTASVMTKMGFIPDLILIDNHTKRGKEIPALMVQPDRKVSVKNPPGTLGDELIRAISDAERAISIGEVNGPILIDVDGEEDLSSLACIDLFRIGGTVVYGQPDAGLVTVKITEEKKSEIKEILREMEV